MTESKIAELRRWVNHVEVELRRLELAAAGDKREVSVSTWRRDVSRLDVLFSDEKLLRRGRGSPLRPWSIENTWKLAELVVSDVAVSQSRSATVLKYEMDVDEQTYVGDHATAVSGLVNDARVRRRTVSEERLIDELADLLAPDVLVPPSLYGMMHVTPAWIERRARLETIYARRELPLSLRPLKWVMGGVEGLVQLGMPVAPRVVAYDRSTVWMPLSDVGRTPVGASKIEVGELADAEWVVRTSYYARVGELQIDDPSRITYLDVTS